MISPRYFDCSSYAEMLSKLIAGQTLRCESLGISIKADSGHSMTVYASSQTWFGIFRRIDSTSRFPLTEDGVQVAIMTALYNQQGNGYLKGVKVVRESQGPPRVLFTGSMKNAEPLLVEIRNELPDDSIYLEPVLKTGFLGKLFGSI